MGEMKNSSEQLIECNEGCMCGCKCERGKLLTELKNIKKLMKQKWEKDDSEIEKTDTKSDHPEEEIDKISEKIEKTETKCNHLEEEIEKISEKIEKTETKSDYSKEEIEKFSEKDFKCDREKNITEENVSEKKDFQHAFKQKNNFYTDKVCRDVPIPCKYHSGNFIRKRLQKSAKIGTEVKEKRDGRKIQESAVSTVVKEIKEAKSKETITDKFERQMNPKLYLSRRLRERIPQKLLDQVGGFDARKPEDIICLQGKKCSLKSTPNNKALSEKKCSRFNVF